MAQAVPPVVVYEVADRMPHVLSVAMAPSMETRNVPFIPINWAGPEDPHPHQETGDPTPRAAETDVVSTSSGPEVPFIPRYDASADVIRHHFSRCAAAYAAITAASFDLPPRCSGSFDRRMKDPNKTQRINGHDCSWP